MYIGIKYPMVNKLQDIEIVELEESDCKRVIGLINSVQPHIPWSEDHFYWQYFGRHGYRAKIFGAKHQDELIGFYAAVKNTFLLEGNICDAYMVQDVMTAEDFRGRGILHLMGEACSSAIDESGGIGFTFPNEKSANSFRRLGWSEIMDVPLREAKCGQAAFTSTVHMSEVAAFEKSVNEIWDHSGMRSGIYRDVEYLNWRYSKPGIQYLKYIVGDFAGYFVLKIFRSEHELKVHLRDLVVIEKEIERVGDVLNFVLSTANDLGARSVTCWLPEGHMYESSFVKLGFSNIKSQNRSIFLRNNSKQGALLSNEGQWHFSQGDSDVF
jgi:hypothetical protein